MYAGTRVEGDVERRKPAAWWGDLGDSPSDSPAERGEHVRSRMRLQAEAV